MKLSHAMEYLCVMNDKYPFMSHPFAWEHAGSTYLVATNMKAILFVKHGWTDDDVVNCLHSLDCIINYLSLNHTLGNLVIAPEPRNAARATLGELWSWLSYQDSQIEIECPRCGGAGMLYHGEACYRCEGAGYKYRDPYRPFMFGGMMFDAELLVQYLIPQLADGECSIWVDEAMKVLVIDSEVFRVVQMSMTPGSQQPTQIPFVAGCPLWHLQGTGEEGVLHDWLLERGVELPTRTVEDVK